MEISQQIVGVNQRLGNTAVPNMQGTTRAIFDILTNPNGNSLTFFQDVQTRPYPFSNINQNRFEVGESLAIESIAFVFFEEGYSPGLALNNYLFAGNNAAPLLNLYIGNQRVIKDLDLSYSSCTLGNTQGIGTTNAVFTQAVFRLETPIVIPPQIEFYATLKFATSQTVTCGLILQGTGTLLNTQENF